MVFQTSSENLQHVYKPSVELVASCKHSGDLWQSLVTALQAATILVAMASGKKFWQPKFWQKLPIGDQQIKSKTYLTNYQ